LKNALRSWPRRHRGAPKPTIVRESYPRTLRGSRGYVSGRKARWGRVPVAVKSKDPSRSKDVLNVMAYSVELTAEVDRELGQLDPQHSKRILKFLHERVCQAGRSHAASEQSAGTARGLGEFLEISRGRLTGFICKNRRRSSGGFWSCASGNRKEILSLARLPETVQ